MPCFNCRKHRCDYVTHDGKSVCCSCVEELDLHTCYQCHNLYLPEYMYDSNMCYQCKYPDGIYRYSYKPSPKFIGKGKYQFGLELEIVYNQEEPYKQFHNSIENINKKFNHVVYMKYDRCVAKVGKFRGMEVVTHPIGSDHIEKVTKDITDYLNKDYVCPDEYGDNKWSCGMHVHVGKRKLFNTQKTGLTRFMYTPSNTEFLLKFSNRTKDNFERWCENRWDSDYSIEEVVLDRTSCTCSACIPRNIMGFNLNTLELRLFKSTLDHKELMRNIQFVIALLDWHREDDDGKMNYQDFISYVRDNRKDLGYLYDYCKNYV